MNPFMAALKHNIHAAQQTEHRNMDFKTLTHAANIV